MDQPTFLLLEEAVSNVKPFFGLQKSRLGGVTIQLPVTLPEARQNNIALRWILQAARKNQKANAKKGASFDFFLSQEILNAAQRQGEAFKKRNELHKIAESNRGFLRRRSR